MVFFSGGELSTIFGKYVAEIKRTDTRVAWDKLIVVYYNGRSEQQTVKGKSLSFGEIMLGLSGINKWKKELKGKVAIRRTDPAADARAISSDLACGD